MRALHVVSLTGADGVRLVEVPEPEGEGVLIDVRAVGVRFTDLLRSQGLYQERSEPPYIPFTEASGVVRHAPAGSGFAAGDRVFGSVTDAAAERAIGAPASLVHLPPELTFAQGAAIGLNYQTAVLGLETRGRMRAGDIVLVHGAAGGTGTAAIQVAKGLGGQAIAVVSSDEKERVARMAGADEVVRSDGPWKDEALRLTGGRGVDLVWDPVGGDRATDTLRVLAPQGRWVVIGFVGGPIPSVPLNRVLLKNVDIVGAFYSGWTNGNPGETRRLRDRVSTLMAGGHVKPVVGSVHPLADGAAALRTLSERRALGKVVIAVP